MSKLRIVIVVTMAAVIGTLLYMVIDGAISLTYSHSHIKYLNRNCEVLAKLVEDGFRGRAVDSVVKGAGATSIAKFEGQELRLDNVVLRVENGKVTGVDIAQTCR
jgi:hypothetical protein